MRGEAKRQQSTSAANLQDALWFVAKDSLNGLIHLLAHFFMGERQPTAAIVPARDIERCIITIWLLEEALID